MKPTIQHLIVAIFACSSSCAMAQLPETLYVAATNPNPVSTRNPLYSGVRYVVTTSGAVSYWRKTPPDSIKWPDADAAFVYHVPYVAGVIPALVDTVNKKIGFAAYLPCNGGTCSSIPSNWGCGNVVNGHQTILTDQRIGVDQNFVSINGEMFCPRNGADREHNIYYHGLNGNDKIATVQIHDGDGDFVNNWGGITIEFRRLGPACRASRDTIGFGSVDANAPVRSDSVMISSFGSPMFPGCSTAVPPLTVTADALSGDVATAVNDSDGFFLESPSLHSTLVLSGTTNAGVVRVKFSPRRKAEYRGVLTLTTNDAQNQTVRIALMGISTTDRVGISDEAPLISDVRSSGLESMIFPNPFREGAVLRWRNSVAENGSIVLLDVLGNHRLTLVNERMRAGQHEIDVSSSFAAANLSPGTYLLVLRTASGLQSTKTLVKW